MSNLTPAQLDAYQQGALITAVFPLERAVDYCALGLTGEIGEWIEKRFMALDEIDSEEGDVWWYVAALADAFKWPLSEVAAHPRPARTHYVVVNLARATAEIAGAVKKSIRDDSGIITEERADLIKRYLSLVIVTLEDSARDRGTFAWAVMQRNLSKLEARKRAGTIKGDGDYR